MASNEASTPTVIPNQSSSAAKWKAGLLGWLPVALGLFAWISSAFDGPEWAQHIRIFGIFAAYAISVTIHEAAHFVVARILGFKPWCFRVGHGEPVIDKQFKSFRLILRSLPYSGAIYPYLPGSRPKEIVMTLAGPLSNVALFFLSIIASAKKLQFDFTDAPVQMLLVNAFLIVVSLSPYYSNNNDGTSILNLLRGKSRKPASNNKSRRSIHPGGPSWEWLVHHVPTQDFLPRYREALNRSDLSTDQRCELLDAVATAILFYGAPEFLEEADRCSEELIQSKPNEWTVKGTRGGVLIEKGEVEAGAAMLKEVMMHSASVADRSISASFLALAELKQNNPAEARRWIQTSRELDPNCVSMLRIETLLKKAKG